ncbi:hypothetical protein SAMN04487947_0848 [Halogeometricum rufum]|uniref:Uncharacterized protein n=1 Tax=Halogeometricum rufum TaxID=553469 RepID=A0A1I6GAY8_9EURY|nr:hypothetical protein [Halogeometricum rufum]SFR39335.1 hypothetical protein SAMN04487947_0848 [Halogeometricum rufum]
MSDRGRRDGPLGRESESRADRALSPVVGKALELGIVVLFIALLTTTFYGDVVPDYRTAAAAEVGERALVGAAESVESSVPSRTARIDRRVAVSLPATIRGDPYRVRAVPAANGSAAELVLDHPDDGVGGRVTLSFPARGANVSGTWRSVSESWVVVRGDGGHVAVTLSNGTPAANDGATAGRVEASAARRPSAHGGQP